MARERLLLLGASVWLKLLLLPAYASSDFEVHRHWLALTSSLPPSRWYVDTTSQWTLDYPPFFAYFERALATLAPLFDPQMLVLSSLPYSSPSTILFQRLTVILTDTVLLLGAVKMCRAPGGVALCLLNAGLLLVDHVHFQYNGFLIGLFLLALAQLREGEVMRGALTFSVLLNLKHLFLFAAPLVFVQLLSQHVLGAPSPSAKATRFLSLAALVTAVFSASLGPFIAAGQLKQDRTPSPGKRHPPSHSTILPLGITTLPPM